MFTTDYLSNRAIGAREEKECESKLFLSRLLVLHDYEFIFINTTTIFGVKKNH